MTSATHEHTINVALGEVLGRLRRSWTTRSEQTGQVLKGGGRPDILIEEASGWPVVIEAERSNYTSAEDDAKARLGRVVASSDRAVDLRGLELFRFVTTRKSGTVGGTRFQRVVLGNGEWFSL